MDINMKISDFYGEIDSFYELDRSHLEFIADMPPLTESVTRRLIQVCFDDNKYEGLMFKDWTREKYEGSSYFSKEDIVDMLESSSNRFN